MRWLRDLWRRLREWWRRRRKPKPLNKVENVKTEITMTKNVTVTWTLPTTRTGGGEVGPEDVSRTVVQLSADGGANFVELDVVPPTAPQSVFVPDLEVGEFHFMITPFDIADVPGEPHVEVVTVADDSPLSKVTNVQVTQE